MSSQGEGTLRTRNRLGKGVGGVHGEGEPAWLDCDTKSFTVRYAGEKATRQGFSLS
jgi:hypothetical protein